MRNKKKTKISLVAKKISLSVMASKLLRDTIQSKSEGYDQKQIRALVKIVEQFDENVKLYEDTQQAIVRAGRKRQMDTLDGVERVCIQEEANDELLELDENEGLKILEYIWSETEWNVVNKAWKDSSNFRASTPVIKLVCEVADAIDNVEDIDLQPVKKE